MFPPKGSGLEQIIKMLEAQRPGLIQARPLNIPDPLQSLQKLQNSLQTAVSGITKNLTAAISQITQKTPQEDYYAIATSFIPADARLVTPEYPSSDALLQADIDGDSNDELIASYKQKDGILRTMILKKQRDEWSKIMEIAHPDADKIHYRNTGRITGNGKLQLLLGLTSNNKYRNLHCYSLNENKADELFSQNYSKLEVLGPGKSGNARIALWNENNDETYDIDLVGWNGKQLDRLDPEKYYFKKVLPYYARNAKKNPKEISNWYHFADALAKAGARKDAETVIEYGRKFDRNSEYKDKFDRLLSRM